MVTFYLSFASGKGDLGSNIVHSNTSMKQKEIIREMYSILMDHVL
jgi:hypothetical protein